MTATTSAGTVSAHGSASVVRIRLTKALRGHSKNAFLLSSTTVFLTIFGLVMVFSSSIVESRAEDGSMLGGIAHQSLLALVGIPVMLIASRVPEKLWVRWARPALWISTALQFLVVFTPLGVTRGGNRNWIAIGEIIQFQPSELVKVAMVLWIGAVVNKRQQMLNDFWRGVFPTILVTGFPITLVLMGGDLGTVMVMGITLLGALFFVGVRLRYMIFLLLGAVAVFGLAAITSGNRMRRIMAFLNDSCTNAVDAASQGACWQIQHGTFALANGNVFGVGLGNSTAKWSWLPEADNDFIFAIVGEELGLIGAVALIGLFILLAFAFARVLKNARTPFATGAIATVATWIIAQAAINIGVVLGVLPVLGVPLPLVSAGGTALVSTLFAVGIALSMAKDPVPRTIPDEIRAEQVVAVAAAKAIVGK